MVFLTPALVKHFTPTVCSILVSLAGGKDETQPLVAQLIDGVLAGRVKKRGAMLSRNN